MSNNLLVNNYASLTSAGVPNSHPFSFDHATTITVGGTGINDYGNLFPAADRSYYLPAGGAGGAGWAGPAPLPIAYGLSPEQLQALMDHFAPRDEAPFTPAPPTGRPIRFRDDDGGQ